MDDFATFQKLKDKFEALCLVGFNVTGGGIMITGLEEEQTYVGISLHLDTWTKELIEEYQNIHKKFIKQKYVPMSPGLVLNKEDCPEHPDPIKQKHYRSTVAKIQFAAYRT